MAAGDDYTVGVAQSVAPDRYIDNETAVNDAGTTVARQKVSTPRSDAIMSQLNRVLGLFGQCFDTAARQRTSIENIAAGVTLPTVTTVTGVTTVTTLTTVGTVTVVTGLTNIGGLRAEMDQVSAMNCLAASIRDRITVAP